MRRVTVVTSDVVRSRALSWSAAELSMRLSVMSEQGGLLTPFAVSRGDEIQAVLDGWLQYPEVIRRLRYAVYPLALRVGIGLGELSDESLRHDPWSMNGEPFYRARRAVEQEKKTKVSVTRVISDFPEVDELVNSMYRLMDVMEQGWSQKQWEAIQTYERVGNYEQAASILGIRFQNVQKRCKAAHWHEIRHAESVLSRVYLGPWCSPHSRLSEILHPGGGETFR